MKKLFLSFGFVLLFIGFAFAQDVIVKTNGVELQTKVVEITGETIKYKEFDYLEGPIKNIGIDEVFMIIYENGRRETFSPIEQPAEEDEEIIEPEEPAEVITEKELPPAYKGNYFMLATGYGHSYGGLGIRLQLRGGGKVGFGFHFGGGIDPAQGVRASAGLKFFPYKGLYLNTQFGILGYDSSFYSNFDMTLGPSALIGGDWNWGRNIGIGFNLAAGLSYAINSPYDYNLMPAFDIGFVLRF